MEPAKAKLPDLELRCYLWLTRRLPDLPGITALYNRLLKPLYMRKARFPVMVSALGLNWELEVDEAVDTNILFAPQLYERAETEFLITHLNVGDTFLDIGSNIGYYALLAAQRVGAGGRVIAIEADPYTFEKLKKHVEINHFTQLTPLQVGASDEEGFATLYVIEGGNRGMSSFSDDRRAFGSARPTTVPCKTLLQIVEEANLTQIKGMKIDIEGMEYPVLQAFFDHAPNTLFPTFLTVEHINFEREMKDKQHDTLGMLKKYGYEIALKTDANYCLVRRPSPRR